MEKHLGSMKCHNPIYGVIKIFTLAEVKVDLPWSVLSHFNIEEYLKSEKISVLENKDNTDVARFTCEAKTKEDVKKIIETFVCKNIHSAAVQFQSNLALKLLLLNGELNPNVLTYLQTLCGKTEFLYVNTTSGMCYIYSKTLKELHNLEQTIAQAIVEMVYTESELKHIHAIVEKWHKANKLIPCCKSDYATKFVATRDVFDDLEKNAVYEHLVQITSLESELLSKCEELKSELMNLSKSLSITVVYHDKQAKLLILKGTKKRVKELISKLRNIYVQIEDSYSVPLSKVHSINDELQKVGDENSFSVDITVSSPSQEVDIGEKVIASWHDSDGSGIYLVKGDLLALKVDFIVILTTTVLFPLYCSKEFNTEPVHRTTNFKKYEIGEVVLSENTPQRCNIPVLDNNQRRDDAVWDDQLRSCFRNGLGKIAGNGLTKVAIHASVIDESVVPHFLQIFVEMSVEHHLVSYICCQSFEEITPVHNIIQESLLLCSNMFRRNLHFDNVQGFHKIAVEIKEGSIVEEKADVLVNTADTSLDLQKGSLSQMFYQHAGQEIQDECKKLHPEGVPFGKCAVTSGGRLAKNGVRNIVHCVLPVCDKAQFKKDVKHMVKLCLRKADVKTSKSIAFPSIGMGNLGYPVHETQYAMLQAVEEYQYEAVCSNLETVVFVVYQKENDDMYKSFVKKRDAVFQKSNTKNNPELLNVGLRRIAVEIRKGSIVHQKVDVLVNTADPSLDLQKGQMSKLFYQHGGKEIEDECHKLHPNGLPERTCTVTSAGRLANNGVRNIVHCVLPDFKKMQFEKDVKDIVKLCLMHADKKSCKSIAFPMIGMGRLGYPVLETKYAMLQAVEEYQYEAVCSTLETVVFVVYEHENDGMYEQFLKIKDDVFSQNNKKSNRLNIEFPGIHKVINKVKICVTSNSVKNYLPLSTVAFNVTVDGQRGQEDVRLSKGHIVFPSLPSHTTVEHAIEMCIKSKVMDVVFYIFEGTKDNVVRIISAVEGAQNQDNLRNVYIVSSNELLEQAQQHYSTWMNRFLRDWTKTNEFLQCSVKVLTLKNKADYVFTKCQQVLSLKNDKQHSGNVAFSSSVYGTDWDVDEPFVMVEQPEQFHRSVHEETFEISARINSGITKYLHETDIFQTWLQDIKEVFNVSVKSHESSELIVTGTITNVTLFEHYLMTDFPKSPVRRSNANNTEKRAIANRTETLEQGNKNDGSLEQTYSFGDLTVKVCYGDIADCSEDCIISPRHEYMKKTIDVARQLLKKGGPEYKKACEKLEKHGKMYLTECRVSDAGKLKCRKVIHVCIPSFDMVNPDNLNVLEEAIFNCLETAGAYGLSAVAIPAVGTGSGALQIEHSAQQISRAINRFTRNNRFVTHVNVVLLEEQMAMKFKINNDDDKGMPGRKVLIQKKKERTLKAFENMIHVYFPPFMSQTSVDAVVVHSKTHLSEPFVTDSDQFLEKIDQFTCTRIVHISLPVWNPEDYPDITVFEREVRCKTETLINVFKKHKLDAAALPLFGESGKPESFQSPLLRACVAMIRGLERVKQLKNIGILKLYILSSNMDFVEMFYDLLKREK